MYYNPELNFTVQLNYSQSKVLCTSIFCKAKSKVKVKIFIYVL